MSIFHRFYKGFYAFVPDFKMTTKLVIGPTATEYHFTFTNYCVAVIVYNSLLDGCA